VVDAVAGRAVFEHNLTDEAAVEKKLEGAIDGGAADGRQVLDELLRAEIVLTDAKVLDD
jgi:hypothetical protein